MASIIGSTAHHVAPPPSPSEPFWAVKAKQLLLLPKVSPTGSGRGCGHNALQHLQYYTASPVATILYLPVRMITRQPKVVKKDLECNHDLK